MEGGNLTEQILEKKVSHGSKVHHILAHSYTLYFVLFLIGVCFDFIFSARGGSAFGGKIFTNPISMLVGFIFLIFGTFLILWSQKTSRNLDIENISKETFSQGPYRYTRSPTHWGLFFMVLGFGIVANALFVVLSTLVSFLISRFVFLKKQEDILALKYGAPYLEYRKSVKL